MIIKEFMIRRYGPLPDSGLKKLGGFNLFFGQNEEGKTLTIDALLKMLLGKGSKYSKGAKRVNENPEGYLIIEDGIGSEKKLPEAGTVKDIFGLSPAEFLNIFVIRDSDLSIMDEHTFYHGLTSRLTGLRTGEIEDLKVEVCELSGITPGGDYQNTSPLKLKDNIKKAFDLLEKSQHLLAELRTDGFSRFEEKLAELEANRRLAVEQINLYSAAQNRELYEKGTEAQKELRTALEEVEILKSYNKEDLEAWQGAEVSREHYISDLERIDREMKEHQASLHAARIELHERKQVSGQARQQTLLVSEKIEPRLAEYERKERAWRIRAELTNSPLFNRSATISSLVMLLSLTGLIIQPSWWFTASLVISSLLAVLLAGVKYTSLIGKSRLAGLEAQVCSEAAKCGLPAGDIRAVQAGIGSIKQELIAAEGQLFEAEKWLDWQQKEAERLRKVREDIIARIDELERKINQARHNSAQETLADYYAALTRKEKLKTEIDKQAGILGSHFGHPNDSSSYKEGVSFWQEQLRRLQVYADAAKGLSFSQQEQKRLAEKKEAIEKEAKKLKEKMQVRSEQLRDIEKEANKILHTGEASSLPCQTTLDLEMVQYKLETWLQEHENKRLNAKTAFEIINAVMQEEEEKVTALFGSTNPVSEYFSQITGGRYREVIFESKTNKVKVISSGGSVLAADQLSGGAYDQLYFSIRLALAEKLLAGQTGFFILDDPFIKADPERLELLLRMLARISERGWQILYFSAKKEVKDALEEQIKSAAVKELQIS